MTNYDLEEAKLLKWQFALSLLFIFTLIVSLTLTYNQILIHEKKPPLYKEKTSDDILKLNRTLGLLIGLGFLYINYIDKGVKEEHNLDLKSANLQIDAGILSVLAAIIVLYVSFMGDGTTELENPEI
ncbi:MAG: hypothetical protein HFH47_02815 [Bacilli bacterium]|nr:hypothetical protein [Bacilli bacterium]